MSQSTITKLPITSRVYQNQNQVLKNIKTEWSPSTGSEESNGQRSALEVCVGCREKIEHCTIEVLHVRT